MVRPYQSEAHRQKIYELARQGKIAPDVVAAMDAATEGVPLPQHATEHQRRRVKNVTTDILNRRKFYGGHT